MHTNVALFHIRELNERRHSPTLQTRIFSFSKEIDSKAHFIQKCNTIEKFGRIEKKSIHVTHYLSPSLYRTHYMTLNWIEKRAVDTLDRLIREPKLKVQRWQLSSRTMTSDHNNNIDNIDNNATQAFQWEKTRWIWKMKMRACALACTRLFGAK